MYQRILVATDGGLAAASALHEAIKLAKATHGVLRIVHVLNNTPLLLDVDFAASKAGAERLLDEACAAASKAGIAADRVLIDNSDGTFADHLGAQAKAWGADLIVVGTNNRTGLRRLLLGSDARNILRTASTPVMVVRAVDGTPPGEPDRQA